LLLLITVGAVASAWGLYQQLASRGQANIQALDKRQKASSTSFAMRSAFKNTSTSNDTIMISFENTGNRAVNFTEEIALYAKLPGEQTYLSYDTLNTAAFSSKLVPGARTCLKNQGVISPGDTVTCNTGIKWPSVGNTISVRLTYSGLSGFNWDINCDPQTMTTSTC
ncbi:MAG: hypothetical protein ABEJ83_05660, partial [Candidatus Nanohaloarchaea archaeon]